MDSFICGCKLTLNPYRLRIPILTQKIAACIIQERFSIAEDVWNAIQSRRSPWKQASCGVMCFVNISASRIPLFCLADKEHYHLESNGVPQSLTLCASLSRNEKASSNRLWLIEMKGAFRVVTGDTSIPSFTNASHSLGALITTVAVTRFVSVCECIVL